ncbi:hypothetical protein [Scardovia wiggsiae]|jgi:hypothetical protein|uniref:hypothetical protein n=1 Tax=Scardovia wiggsiae TaxID=230143 RepID=UPI00374F00F0
MKYHLKDDAVETISKKEAVQSRFITDRIGTTDDIEEDFSLAKKLVEILTPYFEEA